MSVHEAAIFMHLVKCYDEVTAESWLIFWLKWSCWKSSVGPCLHKPCGATMTEVEKQKDGHRWSFLCLSVSSSHCYVLIRLVNTSKSSACIVLNTLDSIFFLNIQGFYLNHWSQFTQRPCWHPHIYCLHLNIYWVYTNRRQRIAANSHIAFCNTTRLLLLL